ncbi:MAG: fatty acid hydroxylase [Massilia sp.]|nr:fatty acid hydroxylase [Massilia sp.]
MNPIVFAIPVFLVTILIEAWIARRRKLQVYDIADAVTSLHLGVLSQVTGLLVRVVAFGIYVAVYERYRATTLPAGSPWVWAGALLAYDFCYYWLHRMGHEVAVLWAAHVVHHTSEYYNLSTALRQTSSGWLLGWMFYLPMAVAGVPPAVLAGVGLIDLLYQYWVHTELVGRLGWFDRVFVTPSNHRVHHGQNDYCIDKNYGGILILWDRLFGTFADERADERIVYGVRKPLASFNPLWGNLHYYADLWQVARAAPGWRAKLGVWVAPPGGWTDAPIEHFDATRFERFSTGTPAPLRWYAALQFALLVPFISHFIAVVPDLGPLQALLYAVVILACTLIVGALLEGRGPARRAEQARTVALGLAFALLPEWFGYDAPLLLRAALFVAMLGSAAWLSTRQAAHA